MKTTSDILYEISSNISNTTSTINVEQIDKCIDMLSRCKGNIITIGTGKSGIIAHEISSLFATSGSVSFNISPLDAMHGEIGSIRAGDAVIIFSKSGNTNEIARLMKYISNIDAYKMLITSNQSSKIGDFVQDKIVINDTSECCPFEVLPTTSIIEQLIVGIAVVLGVMQKKNVPLTQLLHNHPEGSLGAVIEEKLKK